MNPIIYRQNDPRWGGLPYKTNPYTVAGEGCGLCSVTHCAIELDQYKTATPKTFYSFMKQYATNGDGTEWLGIDKGLEKFVGNYQRHYNMTSFFNELNKGNRIGVILFGRGTAPDGTVWTYGGHYVAFVQYKVEGGLHWFYTKDSNGSRMLDGWRSYEKSLKGCIPDVMWTCVLPGWHKVNNAWYFYNTDGSLVKDGWRKDSKGKWFYLGSDGKMVSSKWVKYKDQWYYLKDNGMMAENEWAKDKLGWCYLGKGGAQVKDAWVRYKNNMYYIKPDGYMATGEMTLPCKFNKDGKLEASL